MTTQNKKKVNKKTEEDKTVIKDFNKIMDDSLNVIEAARKTQLETIIAWAAKLGLSEIKVGQTQEYDDNNYYYEREIQNIVGDGTTLTTALKQHHLDSEFVSDFDSVTEMEPSNSYNYITEGGKNKYHGVSTDEVENYDYGEFALYCLKNDIDVEEIRDFLNWILTVNIDAIPGSWQGEGFE